MLFTPETSLRKPNKILDGDNPASSVKATLRSLLTKPSLCLLPAASLAIPLSSIQLELLTRLMPIRFSWSLSNSTLLFALFSAVTLATLLVFLPGISYLLRKKDVVKRDVSFLYGSVFFLVLGSLLFMMITGPDFIIAGVVLTALASGTPTLSRALLVSFLPNTKHTGALFGILAVGEIFGFLMCQLGMGVLFDVGLSLWMGLPFGVGMVLAVTIGVLVWMVRVPRAVKDEEDDEGSDWETTSRLSSLDRYQLYLKSLAWYPRRYEITVAQALGGEAIWVGVDR